MAFYLPSNAEIKEVEQDLLPRLMADRPIFDILPIEEVDDDLIIWEQEANYIGLQAYRGINGQPSRVKKVADNRYIVQPGYYGDQQDLNEQDLTRRRLFGTFGTAVDVSDLVAKAQRQLLVRRLDRIEQIGWSLLTLGAFSTFNEDGLLVHTDTFSTQTFTASVSWINLSTATPLQDLRALKLLHRGHSVRFDSKATLYVNQTTLNALLNNTNANDLGGKKNMYGATANLSVDEVNKILLGNDLPRVEAMDEGYIDDSGTFQLFIPNYTGTLVGKRMSGTPIGSYAMTRNANNPDMAAGAYTKVVDHGEKEVPRRIVIHDGHNGGPKLPLPTGIVNCTF